MASPKPARSPMREEVAALKRQRTLDTATDLFYEKGFTNTTLDDVAQRMGVTKPFIYTNFGSKPDLLVAICEIGVRSALEEIERVLEQGPPTRDTLRRFMPGYVAAVLRTQKNIAINIREEKNLLPEHADQLATLRQTFMTRIERLLRDAGGQSDRSAADLRVTAFAIVGAVSWATFWFNPNGPLSPQELADKMTDIILNLVQGTSATA